MKKDDQRYCTRFLAKYGGLYLYDIDTEKRYSIDEKEMHFFYVLSSVVVSTTDESRSEERRVGRKMIRDIVLTSWQSMEDYLYMILIHRRDIPLTRKKCIL